MTRNLEQLVKDPPSRVYILSEVGYDACYFNERAYQNLLKTISTDPDVTGVLIDGALTRVDRPEYLNDTLSYWNCSEEEGLEETRSIANRQQYATMLDRQFEILEKRFRELRQKIPQAKLVFSIDSDDTHYTISAMVNEALLQGVQEIENKIAHLKEKRVDFRNDIGEAKRAISSLSRKRGTGRKRAGLTRRIDNLDRKILNIDEELSEFHAEKNLYREKKARPAHQLFTRNFVHQLHKRFENLCKQYDVDFITSQKQITFGSLKLDYAHSRHDTWAVIKRRDSRLSNSLHGKMKKLLKEGVDAVVESGHHGIGFKQLQKVRDIPQETNFKNQSLYNPEIGEDTISIVMALPFEDQEAIANFLRGSETERTSGGKPINTRKHAVLDRMKHDGVSGVTVIGKDSEGLVNTEWIQYQNFVSGSVLKQPKEYAIISASSDEHIGSPEENHLVRNGMLAQHLQLLETPHIIRGKKAYAKGFISGGDTAEANSRKWDHRYHYKRDPAEVLEENITLLSKSQNTLEDLLQLVLKTTNDARGGSVEDMSVILSRVADYYGDFFWPTLHSSKLKWVHVSVTGNHADGVLRDLGMRESDFFVQRLSAREVEVYEVGKPDYFDPEKKEQARVFIGGYSNARVAQVEDYGLRVDKTTGFGPINLILQHDPKGGGISGLVGAGRSVEADVSLAGHTHENQLKTYNVGNNQFRIAYRLATLQGVSATEKYYASSLPRTQAGHRLVMPVPGHFWEQALPAGYLRQKGYSMLIEKLEEARKAS